LDKKDSVCVGRVCDETPIDFLAFVNRLLVFEDMIIELLLKTLIAVIDTKLSSWLVLYTTEQHLFVCSFGD
jgi:hypothetical protein